RTLKHELFGLWNRRLAKKSLQPNPKFGLTGPALRQDFGDAWARSALGDELGPELAADPPDQAALARVARREDQGELGRGVEVLGNDLHTTVGNVRDDTVARQRAGPELNLRETPAQATLASTTIDCCQHDDLLPHRYLSVLPRVYSEIVGIG